MDSCLKSHFSNDDEHDNAEAFQIIPEDPLPVSDPPKDISLKSEANNDSTGITRVTTSLLLLLTHPLELPLLHQGTQEGCRRRYETPVLLGCCPYEQ